MFCIIERLVSLPYEFFLAPGVRRRGGYADAYSHLQGLAVRGKNLVHNSLSKPLSDIFAAVSVSPGQYDCKFFTPVSGRHINVPDHFSYNFRDPLQHKITRRMAISVIHFLEKIDVSKEQRNRSRLSVQALEFP